MNCKSILTFVFSLLTVCATVANAADTKLQVRGLAATLSFASGDMWISADRVCASSRTNSGPLWSLTLIKTDNHKHVIYLGAAKQDYRTEATRSGFRVIYDAVNGDQKWNIGLVLDVNRTVDGAFAVSATISNNEPEWLVTGFTGPIIDGIDNDIATAPLYMPTGLGQQFIQFPTKEQPLDKSPLKGALTWGYNKSKARYELSAHYPSRFATMQWCVMAGKDGGLYFGSHDGGLGSKRISVRYEPSSRSMGVTFTHDFICRNGAQQQIAPMVIYPYKGTWHTAADYYRKWYDTSVKMRQVPHWVCDASGWLLTIMKQQNNEIMWDYPSLSKELCDVADARGLDIIGLFGWTVGGHDRFYPHYDPAEDLGGRAALVESIKELKARGKRTIIYANGQLIDQNGTSYWDKTGKYITVVKSDSTLDYQKWHKYRDAPARFHGMACLGCPQWYERMLELAEQANDLGVDGILFDQLAVTAPKFCYATNHGHATPEVVYTIDRYSLLDRIADHMQRLNPDFVVMTEGLTDAVQSSISMFHGYSNGAYVPLQDELTARCNSTAASSVFPEMYMYTFAQMLTTTRNPSPVNNRLIVNYACTYGLRHELEIRYQADVRYLKEDRLPRIEDYDNVISKPNLDLVTSQDPVAMRIYTRQMIDFQRKHKDLLWHGKYVDDKMVELKAPNDVIAKCFVSGDRLAVVVWNTSPSEAHKFWLKTPGYTLVSADAPDKTDPEPFAELPAQSLRLLIMKR